MKDIKELLSNLEPKDLFNLLKVMYRLGEYEAEPCVVKSNTYIEGLVNDIVDNYKKDKK